MGYQLKSFEGVLSSDVVIIGAGPAGLSLAINLGKRNISTYLVDKKNRYKIGTKVCGDILSKNLTHKLWSVAGINKPSINHDELCERITSCVFHLKGLDPITVQYETYSIDRLKYGQRLLNSLIDYPWIKILPEHTFIDLIVKEKAIKGVIVKDKNNQTKRIKTKIVADCSGFNAVARKKIMPDISPFIPQHLSEEDIIIAHRQILKTQTSHNFQNKMFLSQIDNIPKGYFWIFSKGSHLLNVGIGGLKTNISSDQLKPTLESLKKEYLAHLSYECISSSGGNLSGRLPLYSLVAPGFMLCGDAGALVEPLSGAGHGNALISGLYAAIIIEEALLANDFSSETLWKYNRLIWHEFGKENAIGIGIFKLLDSIDANDFSDLFARKIINQEFIEQLFQYEISNVPIRTIIKLVFNKPVLCFYLTKMYFYIKKLQKMAINYPQKPQKFKRWYKKIRKLEKKTL